MSRLAARGPRGGLLGSPPLPPHSLRRSGCSMERGRFTARRWPGLGLTRPGAGLLAAWWTSARVNRAFDLERLDDRCTRSDGSGVPLPVDRHPSSAALALAGLAERSAAGRAGHLPRPVTRGHAPPLAGVPAKAGSPRRAGGKPRPSHRLPAVVRAEGQAASSPVATPASASKSRRSDWPTSRSARP